MRAIVEFIQYKCSFKTGGHFSFTTWSYSKRRGETPPQIASIYWVWKVVGFQSHGVGPGLDLGVEHGAPLAAGGAGARVLVLRPGRGLAARPGLPPQPAPGEGGSCLHWPKKGLLAGLVRADWSTPPPIGTAWNSMGEAGCHSRFWGRKKGRLDTSPPLHGGGLPFRLDQSFGFKQAPGPELFEDEPFVDLHRKPWGKQS